MHIVAAAAEHCPARNVLFPTAIAAALVDATQNSRRIGMGMPRLQVEIAKERAAIAVGREALSADGIRLRQRTSGPRLLASCPVLDV
jgi:hypothetical protein